jgi:hypothetical protein
LNLALSNPGRNSNGIASDRNQVGGFISEAK